MPEDQKSAPMQEIQSNNSLQIRSVSATACRDYSACRGCLSTSV